ncbi:substrate-binding domain-containing protein [Escherichia coli]|nr:substrate-binding domain-containing protein [Escherichia coli]
MQKDFTIDSKTNWTSLLNGGRLAVGDPEHVPAGIYAKKHCKNWAHGIRSLRNWPQRKMFVGRWRWSNVTKRLWALSTVLTQLPAKGKVVATFPEDSHKKVEYPVAVVEGHNNATVKAFYDYLKGPQAAEIFKRYGFTIK